MQINLLSKQSWRSNKTANLPIVLAFTYLCFIKALCGSLHGLCGHLQKTSYNPCHEWKGMWSTLSCVMSLHWMIDSRFYISMNLIFCRTRRRKRSNNKHLWAEYMLSHQQLFCESDIFCLLITLHVICHSLNFTLKQLLVFEYVYVWV